MIDTCYGSPFSLRWALFWAKRSTSMGSLADGCLTIIKEWFLQAMALWHPWAPAKLLLEVWQPRSLQDRIEQFASAGNGWVPHGIWQTLWKDGGRRRFRVRTSRYRSRNGATWCQFGETSSRALQDIYHFSQMKIVTVCLMMRRVHTEQFLQLGFATKNARRFLECLIDWFLAFD